MALRPPAAGTLLPSQAFSVEIAGHSVLHWARLLSAKLSDKPLEVGHARSFPRLLMMMRAPEATGDLSHLPRVAMVDDLAYCLHSMVWGKSPRQANGYLQGLTGWSKHPLHLNLIRECALATGDLDSVIKVDATVKTIRVDHSKIRRQTVVCEMKCWEKIQNLRNQLARGEFDQLVEWEIDKYLSRLLRSGQVRTSREVFRLWLLLEAAAATRMAIRVLSKRREFFLENEERRQRWPARQLIVYDLETVHDSDTVFGDREDLKWLDRTRVVQFAARNYTTGEEVFVECRSPYEWSTLSSSAQKFCRASGSGKRPFNASLPLFPKAWRDTVIPFLQRQRCRGPLVMAAFNGKQFDNRVMKHYGLPGWRPLRKIDPLIAARRVGHPHSGFSLSSLYRYRVGGWAPGVHTAQGDVDMLVDLIREWPELNEAVMEDFNSVDRRRRRSRQHLRYSFNSQ
ncbi:hypothetical protein Pmar_PMAR026030 [Perkinsus marinus ATCC 50983]|uniref:Uncharacterized protein n=1 Tax=Perkinsus marinus (strain ATCC 50983 / TXsc) TaxID=423536 RepID=C5LK84_PERM5|nr:hypothetical protein Pmar_PMAR026030 [Perkinsus marinus ATCC 50983]EER02871.1 hypothetical protein Pmar_PMAR026030 [Perkinsus marinus ATCC 50983]|eukprot:XP_002771055.1 hypothetical protein Pmar_PMAR026030 [Perkinsus marinus ATCC 50983]